MTSCMVYNYYVIQGGSATTKPNHELMVCRTYCIVQTYTDKIIGFRVVGPPCRNSLHDTLVRLGRGGMDEVRWTTTGRPAELYSNTGFRCVREVRRSVTPP